MILDIVGLCSAEVKALGPVQDQDVAPVAPPVKIKVLPIHIGLGVAEAVTAVGKGQAELLKSQLQLLPPPPILTQFIPLYRYKQESVGAKVINPNAGKTMLAVSTRVIKKPLSVELKSSKAELSGAAPVAFIPTLCASTLKVNKIKLINTAIAKI